MNAQTRPPAPSLRAVMAREMTEDDLLNVVTQAATYAGWRWHHVRRSDKALQQGHSGFPDLVMARRGRVLFLELKREGGQPRPDQLAWQYAINGEEEKRSSLYLPTALTILPASLDGLLRQITDAD